jgi:hypothetical protein
VRWVEVPPERLERWVAGFAERHGGDPAVEVVGGALVLTAPDGSIAECQPPVGVAVPATVAELAAPPVPHIGLVLARRGGYAIGLATATGLTASKVDSRYVQGRTAAGGQSQQRFARRRENQAKAAAGEAADACLRLLVPAASELRAVVTGGDRRFVESVLADPRLAPLRPLRADRFLDVPDPKRAVLESALVAARSVRIGIDDRARPSTPPR